MFSSEIYVCVLIAVIIVFVSRKLINKLQKHIENVSKLISTKIKIIITTSLSVYINNDVMYVTQVSK